MHNQKVAVTVIAGAALLSGCSSFVNGSRDPQFDNRFYVGAGALVSKVEPDTDKVVGTSVDDSGSAGGSVSAGYDLNDRISVEGHLASLGKATLDPAGSIDYTVGGLSGILYGLNQSRDRARREGFSVFGRLGVGAMDNSASGVQYKRVNDVHLLAGAGVEYGLENGLGVRAEFVAHETDAKYAQLGLIYRFGESTSSVIGGSTVVDLPAPKLPAPEDATPADDRSVEAQADADGDGIPDAADRCPGSAVGEPVKADGCSYFDGVVEGVNFEPGSDTLTAGAALVLDDIVNTLRAYPYIRIVIEAHTDNVGKAADNLQLSKRRAIAVARYLVNAGISGSRLKPKAYGESRPRMSNLTAEGRAANRRVEITLLQ